MVPAQPGLFGNVSSNPSGSALPAPETRGHRSARHRHPGSAAAAPGAANRRDRQCPPGVSDRGLRAPTVGTAPRPSGGRMLGGSGRGGGGKGKGRKGREGEERGGAPRPSTAEPEHSPRVGSFVPGAGSLFFIRLMGCGCIIPFHMLLMNHSGQCICINVQSTGGGWSGCIWPSLTFPRRPAFPTRGPAAPESRALPQPRTDP